MLRSLVKRWYRKVGAYLFNTAALWKRLYIEKEILSYETLLFRKGSPGGERKMRYESIEKTLLSKKIKELKRLRKI